MTKSTAAIVGAGSLGTAMAKVMADAGNKVRVWAPSDIIATEINRNHTNRKYTREVILPTGITASSDIKAVLTGADYVLLAIPSQFLRTRLRQWHDQFEAGVAVISLIKGLESDTGLRMSEIVKDELMLPDEQIAVMSGPNLSQEIALELPTATIVASSNQQSAELFCRHSATAYFFPRPATDVIGVELCGVIKNIVSLATGIVEGRGYGDNARALIVTRGLHEMTALVHAVGGQTETIQDIAGIGDIVVTSSSGASRNHQAGKLIGQGIAATEAVARLGRTVEGIVSAPALLGLAKRHHIEVPLFAAIAGIVEGRLSETQGLAPFLR